MTEEGWRRIAMILAVLLGFGAAVLLLPRGGTSGASPTPTLVAGGSSTPSLATGTATPEPPTDVPSQVPIASPTPSPSPT
ncbi:MAG: hypothetical protein ACHQ15_05000, partial [Candidatus Limnocylindrales bacterium]